MSTEDKYEDIKKSTDHMSLQQLACNTYTSLLSRNQESEKKNRKNIQKKIEDLTKHLQEVELSLERDCENCHQKVDESLQATITNYEIIQYELDEMKGFCNQVCAMQMDVEVVQHSMDLKRIFDDINTRLKVQHQPPQIPEFIASEIMPNKDILRQIIGSNVATIIPDKYEIETKFTVICTNMGVSPLGSHCCWIYRIGKGGPVQLVSEDGTIILQNPNEKGRKIEKIFASSCKKSWITDLENSNIEILQHDGELENRFKIKSGYFPFGICQTKSGEAVWICLVDKASFVPNIKGKTKVVKMTIKGVKVCEIESFGGKNMFTFPYRCVENSLNEDLYVVDRQIAENRGQVFFFEKDCTPKGDILVQSSIMISIHVTYAATVKEK
ncbi:unnamed protein product [Mytilus coruscus]|uniref:Uncharacterized protein n=1 Tax=Mytilus coruscus TaxID=42192 RepID=A0A6J7ZUR9_MYTCO|nr:unnamed protein product [Mytilus coruscus]